MTTEAEDKERLEKMTMSMVGASDALTATMLPSITQLVSKQTLALR